MNPLRTKFFAGIVFGCGVDMMVQDLYGLDGYITHLRADWINLSPWIGFFVMLAAMVVAATSKD